MSRIISASGFILIVILIILLKAKTINQKEYFRSSTEQIIAPSSLALTFQSCRIKTTTYNTNQIGSCHIIQEGPGDTTASSLLRNPTSTGKVDRTKQWNVAILQNSLSSTDRVSATYAIKDEWIFTEIKLVTSDSTDTAHQPENAFIELKNATETYTSSPVNTTVQNNIGTGTNQHMFIANFVIPTANRKKYTTLTISFSRTKGGYQQYVRAIILKGYKNVCDKGQRLNSSDVCEPCPSGTFQPNDNVRVTSCTPCSLSGAKTHTGGGISAANCVAASCNPGFSLQNNSCTQCVAGTYNNNELATSCTQAQDGWWAGQGATQQTQCSLPNAQTYTTGGAGLGTSATSCKAAKCNPGYEVSSTGTCNQCGAGKYGDDGITCKNCQSGMSSPVGSTSSANCTCPQGKALLTARDQSRVCRQICNQRLPPRTRGNIQNLILDGFDCTTKQYQYKNPQTGIMQNTNPCTGQTIYNFDTQQCEGPAGSTNIGGTIRCPDETVYNQSTNSCVPVKVITTPDKLVRTKGSPGQGDYNNCKTIDRGDCTLLYKNPMNPNAPKTSVNLCAPNQIYNFDTDSCENIQDTCCSLTPDQLARDPKCAQYVMRNPGTINPMKCPRPTANRCCAPAMSMNIQCQQQGFWSPPTFAYNSLRNQKCGAL